MSAAKTLPSKTKKLIFQEAQCRCPFCGESDVAVLEIHHITERTDGGSNDPENLILVCANCHSKITCGVIPRHEVLAMKATLVERGKRITAQTSATSIFNITGGQHSGIIANTVIVKSLRNRSPKVSYPEGSIGSNLPYRNYIKYLIERYSEFKKADKSIQAFSYAVIYKAIKSEFKSSWNYIPEGQFSNLSFFLQNRIDRTILGKVRRHRGQKNYETFEEFKLRY